MTSPKEKQPSETQVEYSDAKNASLLTVEAGLAPDQVVTEHDKHETRRILRKVDLILVPFLTVLYLISFVDRANIGNAKIAGMEKDLNLRGMRYNVAVTAFFIPYALLEVPSNVVLKLVRPSRWIAIMMFAWGTVMTLMGLVTSYQGLVVARFFLGVAEAGYFPAATYLLTLWYKRYEVQRRMAVFYAATSLAGAFSGLLAYAIQQMDGVAGMSGWKWIFILEGLVAVIASVTVWFFLPDSPETASFLTKAEKEFIINRLAMETGSDSGRVTNSDRIQWRHVKNAFAEWRVWASVVLFWGTAIGVYGFTATVPTVIRDLGYTSAHAQLMTIPIYIFAMIIALIFAFWSDKVEQRTPFIIAGFSIAILGFIGQLAIPHTRLQGLTYFFLFFVAAGLYSPFVCSVCLVANNLAPSSKRAVGMALMASIGNLGGVCGANIFIGAEAPKYPTGFGTCLAVEVAALATAFILRRSLQKENKKRDAFMVGKTAEDVRAMYTEEELLTLGDKSPFFRYTV